MQRVTRAAPGKQLHFLKNLHTRCTLTFLSSPLQQPLSTFCTTTLSHLPLITRIYCLGLDSFSYSSLASGAGVPTMMKFVVFEQLLSLLNLGSTRTDKDGEVLERQGVGKEVSFQGLGFTDVDVAFLRWRGFAGDVVKLGEEGGIVVQDKVEGEGGVFLYAPCGNRRGLVVEGVKVLKPVLMVGDMMEKARHHWDYLKDENGAFEQMVGNKREKFRREIVWEGDRFHKRDAEGKWWAQMKSDLRERNVTRRFYCKRLRRPLWKFEVGDDDEKLAKVRESEMFVEGLQWCKEIWAHWQPDDNSLLKKFRLHDKIACGCFECRAGYIPGGGWSPKEIAVRRDASSSDSDSSTDEEEDEILTPIHLQKQIEPEWAYGKTRTEILSILHKRYEKCYYIFHHSAQKAELRSFFEKKIFTQKNIIINKAINIGMGTMTTLDDDPNSNYQQGLINMSQLIVFQYILLLFKNHGFKLTEGVHLQDPEFNKIDCEFLTTKGFNRRNILGDAEYYDPVAERRRQNVPENIVTPNTFVFNVCFNVKSLITDVLKIAHPKLWFGHSIEYSKCYSTTFNPTENDQVVIARKTITRREWIPHPQETEEMRRVTRPYYSTHFGKPAWEYPGVEGAWNAPDGTRVFRIDGIRKERREKQRKVVPEGFEWTMNMWVYWKPDGKAGLRTVGVEDVLECECFDCQHGVYPGGVPDKGLKINGNLGTEELEKLLGDPTVAELEREPVKLAAVARRL